MPKTASPGAAATRIDGVDDQELSPARKLRVLADALYRAAIECSHQQERSARLSGAPAVVAEQRLARQMCTLANTALGEMAAAYERAAARYQPEPGETWWRRANILWLAAREYQVHHDDCDEASRQLDHPDAGLLAELQVEYELAASALLALRQAADAYRKAVEAA